MGKYFSLPQFITAIVAGIVLYFIIQMVFKKKTKDGKVVNAFFGYEGHVGLADFSKKAA